MAKDKRNAEGLLTGNKGEWSEIYVLLKLLAEGKIYAADDELNALEDIYFPIVKIIREENKGEVTEYHTGQEVRIYLNGEELSSMSKEAFAKEASDLLDVINEVKGTGISSPQTEAFLTDIRCHKLKAPSADKTDISMQIVDINTGFSPTVGFSIKSDLGAAPTLLNASKTTNFIYEIASFPLESVEQVNSLLKGKSKDIKGRATKIEADGGVITFDRMYNKTFEGNLLLIDSLMDRIIAQTVLYYYRDGITNCKDMVKKLEEENPLGYSNKNAYAYKFKKFLTAVALGMQPGKEWNGKDEASGGYIIVTEEGNVLAYHIYNRDCFEEYLLNNTRYETASTTRHEFGEIYAKDDRLFMTLNLQIRFI